MALIKTIQEIRAVIPRLSRLSDTANIPNVDKAGRLHIKPIIGTELYNDLDTKYNDNTASDPEKELIKIIQLPLAAFSLLDDLAFIHTIITDNGIRTATSQQMEAAHRWEYKELQEALISYANDGIEILLDYLYENKADWALWTDSKSFSEIDGLIIKTGADFAKYYHLHQPLRTFWTLRPVLADVEENYFNAAIGRDLMKWIKQQDEIVITVNGGQVDVKKLIKKSAAYLTIHQAGNHLAVRFGENGFTVIAAGGDADNPSTAGRQTAQFNDLQRKLESANKEGQNYLTKCCQYLVNIANGVYTEDFGADFTTAFDYSPLKSDPNKEPYTNGNERRKIFRF